MAKRFTGKQARFIDGVVAGLNSTEAAKQAGYSPKTARHAAHENLTKPHISAEIERRRAKAVKAADVDAARIRQEWARIALAKITDVCEFDAGGIAFKPSDELPEAVLAAIAEVRQTVNQHGTNLSVKLHPKMQALDSLAKDLGMLVDKHQLEVTESKARDLIAKFMAALVTHVPDEAVQEAILADVEGMEDA